jgi:hypothetical protein
VTDRFIRITTALAVEAVAMVAAIISSQHAYELVRSHGEFGLTARLLPFTVDGLIWAASIVVLDACRQNWPVPRLAAWSLGAGIVATVGANLAHGVGHGPVGALASVWPALALVGTEQTWKPEGLDHYENWSSQSAGDTLAVVRSSGRELASMVVTDRSLRLYW